MTPLRQRRLAARLSAKSSTWEMTMQSTAADDGMPSSEENLERLRHIPLLRGPCVPSPPNTDTHQTTRRPASSYHALPGLARSPPPSPPYQPLPDHPPRRRGTVAARAEGAVTDCAVGSGEWAEPPHSPRTLRHRGAKIGIFSDFSTPEDTPKIRVKMGSGERCPDPLFGGHRTGVSAPMT